MHESKRLTVQSGVRLETPFREIHPSPLRARRIQPEMRTEPVLFCFAPFRFLQSLVRDGHEAWPGPDLTFSRNLETPYLPVARMADVERG